MQINKTLLDQLLNLDDQTLSRTIMLLADAAGIDRRAASSAVADLRLVRASLSNASDRDISKAVELLGEERTRALLLMLAAGNTGNPAPTADRGGFKPNNRK